MSQSPPPAAPQGKSPAPTISIVIAGVCAALAISFAISAFHTEVGPRRRAGEAHRRASAAVREQSALSEEERSAAETETKEAAAGTKFQSRYNTVRNRFIAERSRPAT